MDKVPGALPGGPDQYRDASHGVAAAANAGGPACIAAATGPAERADDAGDLLAGGAGGARAQITTDLAEAHGWTVHFAGGGIPNDEIVGWIGQLQPQVLMAYGTIPSAAPMVRQLIDLLHDVGICPKLQFICSGGVFNRAEGLAEEIGADLFAPNPLEALEILARFPQQACDGGTADGRPQAPDQENGEPGGMSPATRRRGDRATRRQGEGANRRGRKVQRSPRREEIPGAMRKEARSPGVFFVRGGRRVWSDFVASAGRPCQCV